MNKKKRRKHMLHLTRKQLEKAYQKEIRRGDYYRRVSEGLFYLLQVYIQDEQDKPDKSENDLLSKYERTTSV